MRVEGVTFMAKNSKAKLPTYDTLWHIQHGHQMVIQACQVSLSIALGIALHHFSSFLTISSPKTKTLAFIFFFLHEAFKEEEIAIFIFFQGP